MGDEGVLCVATLKELCDWSLLRLVFGVRLLCRSGAGSIMIESEIRNKMRRVQALG